MKKKRKKSNSVNPTTSVSASSLSLKHNYKVNNSKTLNDLCNA